MHKFSCTLARFDSYIGSQHSMQYHAAKVGIKSCRGAKECISFVNICTYVCMYVATM